MSLHHKAAPLCVLHLTVQSRDGPCATASFPKPPAGPAGSLCTCMFVRGHASFGADEQDTSLAPVHAPGKQPGRLGLEGALRSGGANLCVWAGHMACCAPDAAVGTARTPLEQLLRRHDSPQRAFGARRARPPERGACARGAPTCLRGQLGWFVAHQKGQSGQRAQHLSSHCAGVKHRSAPLEPEEPDLEGGLRSAGPSRALSRELQDDAATTGLVSQEVVRFRSLSAEPWHPEHIRC